MNEPIPAPPIIDIEAFKNSLKSKSIEELREMLRDFGEKTAALILINVEARVRLHECRYHNQPNEPEVLDLISSSADGLVENFRELAS